MRGLVSFMILAFLAAPVAAERLTHPFGVSIWFPKDWELQSNATQILGFSPDNRANVYFYVIDERKPAEILDNIGKELEKLVDKPIFINRPRTTKVNGLRAYLGDGSGAVEGLPVRWSLGIYEIHDTVLFGIGIYDISQARKYEDAVEKMLESPKEEDPY